MRKLIVWLALIAVALIGTPGVAWAQTSPPSIPDGLAPKADIKVDITTPIVEMSFGYAEVSASSAGCAGHCPAFGQDGKYLRRDAAAFTQGTFVAAGLDAQALSNSSWAVVARVKADKWSRGLDAIFGTSAGDGFVLGVLDGRPYMNFGRNGISGQTRLLPNKWYEIGWRYDQQRGEMGISVDGVLEKIVGGKPALAASGALLVGAAGGASFSGVIDDIRVYNHALSSLELVKSAAYNPVAYGMEVDAAAAQDDPGLIVRDMTISVQCEPDRAYVNQAINYWADAVYEMTDGRHRLGRVSIWTQSARLGSTHVKWNCTPGRSAAYVAARPNFLAGYSIMMFPEDTPQGMGYVLGHEDGHYSYGLYDEYLEWFRFSDPLPSSPLQWDTPVPYSISNDQNNAKGFTPCVEWYPWWQFWNWGKCVRYATESYDGDPAWLNFSTPANDTRNTAQFRMYQASGWGTLGRPCAEDPAVARRLRCNVQNGDLIDYGRGLTGMPSKQLPAGKAEARKYLQIVWMGSQGLAAAGANDINPNGVIREYLVDTSAGMAGPKLAVIQQALTQRIDAAREGDTMGILSFDGTVTERQALVTINAASRAALKTVVANLAAGGADVATGDALAAGLTALTATGVPSNTVRSLYLIGSGAATTGELPANIQAALVENSIALYAFGYDSVEADAIVLTDMADATSGLFTAVSGVKDLQTGLKTADRYSALTQFTGVRTGYEELAVDASRTYTVLIDAGLNLLDYEVWVGAAPGQAEVAIVKPDGSRTVLEGDACEDASEPDAPAMGCSLQVDATPGTWTIEVTNGTGAPSWVNYYVDAYALNGTSTYIASMTSATGETVQYPSPMIVQALLQKNYAIGGANLKAEVNAPDGSYMEFTLRDDGIRPDKLANDGQYAAYVNYWTDGEYYITAQYDNDNLNAYSTNLGVTDQMTITTTLVGENFQRYGQNWITVKGWKADDHADQAGTESTVLTPDNTFVPGRIDRAGDVDTFRVDPAAIGVAADAELFLRVNRLGLDMDPYVQILDKDFNVLHEASFESIPDSDAYLFVPLTMTNQSEVYYVALQHYDDQTDMGVYDISIGPRMEGDPRPATPVGFASAPSEPYTTYFKPVTPGGTVEFTHKFTNTGTVSDTFDITVTAFTGWPVKLQAGGQTVDGTGQVTLTLPSIAAGAVFEYRVLVTPPPDVVKGTTTDILIMVRSRAANWLTASNVDKLAVGDIQSSLYLPHVIR